MIDDVNIPDISLPHINDVIVSVLIGSATIAMAIRCLRRPDDPGKRLRTQFPIDAVDLRPSRAITVRIGSKVRQFGRRPPDPMADRNVGLAVLIGGPLVLVHPLLAVAAVVGLWVRSVAQRRRQARERTMSIVDGLAEVIDLFAIALLTGTTVGAATRQVGRWAGGEFGDAFAWCDRHVVQGRTLADALELLPQRLGPQIRPLTAALVATERYGAPIAQSLMQLGADSRADRRRRAETAARRLPVALLFPLVVCVLPAFLLLTIVPVVADSLSRFDLFGPP